MYRYSYKERARISDEKQCYQRNITDLENGIECKLLIFNIWSSWHIIRNPEVQVWVYKNSGIMNRRQTFATDLTIDLAIDKYQLKDFSFAVDEIGGEEHQLFDRTAHSNNYKVILLTQGACYCDIGSDSLKIDTGHIAVIRPGQFCRVVPEEMTSGFVLSFSYDFLQLAAGAPGIILPHLHPGFNEHYTIPVTPAALLPIAEIALQIWEEYHSCSDLRDEMIRSLFRIFILYVSRLNTDSNDINYGKCSPLVRRFFSLLEHSFTTMKMPADYADMLAVTPAYLNELVKRSCGFTTSYCIQQRIVTEAKRLIMYTELSLKEIAYRIGFEDASHFSKFFKKFTGKRYSDFRRQVAA